MSARPGTGLRRTTLLVMLCVVTFPIAAGSTRLPYEVSARVLYGDPKGPERLRRELQLEIVRGLEAAGCMAAVSSVRDDERPDGDLLLKITLDEFEDRMQYDSSIAQRTSPNAVPQEEQARVTARLSASVFLDLLTLPEGRPVRREKFHVSKGYRPRISEDPRYESEILLVEAVVRSVKRFVCKGSPKKLEREIEAAASGDR